MIADLKGIMARHAGLVAGGAAWGWWTTRIGAWGVLLGGVVMALTVVSYGAGLGAVMRRGSRRLAMILLFAKFLLFLGLGWLALRGMGHAREAIGFAVGVTCFPVAVVWGALRARGIDGTL